MKEKITKTVVAAMLLVACIPTDSVVGQTAVNSKGYSLMKAPDAPSKPHGPMKAPNSTGVVLYGAIQRADSWGAGANYGVYSFTPDSYGFTAVKLNRDMDTAGGAGYIGKNCFFTVSYDDYSEWGMGVFVETHGYSISNWNQLFAVAGDANIISTSLAHDEQTGRTFGCFFNENLDGYEFGEFDSDNIERSFITTLPAAWIASAFDKAGTLYAIDTDGKLWTVNLINGNRTLVGNTGLKSQNPSSGTIDTATGLFYVAVSNPGNSGLYRVNLTNGSATLLYPFADNEAVTGMFVAQHGVVGSVLSKPTALSVSFLPGSLSGSVRFTMPTTDISGNQLTGKIGYQVEIAGSKVAEGTADPGAQVNESVSVQNDGTYTVSVRALIGDNASEAVSTTFNVEGTKLPEHVELPYVQPFDSEEGMNDLIILDGNNDGTVWYWWKGEVYYGFNTGNAADDYLITPGIYMQPGEIYRFTLDIRPREAGYREAFELLIGNSPVKEAMLTSVYDRTVITDGQPRHPIADITVDRAGVYYLAVHACSDVNQYGMFVDNLKVAKGVALKAPGFCEMNAVSASDGSLNANISVKAPIILADGTQSNSVTSIELRRDGKVVKRFDSPSSASTLTFTDNLPETGYYTYSAVAYNAAGEGREIEQRIFVGINYPAAPKWAVAYQTQNPGEVTVEWGAPDTDVDGNPISEELLTYMVATKRPGGSLRIMGRGVTGTSFTFKAVEPDTPQEFLWYLVCSETARGTNDWDFAVATPTPVGKPYDMPYSETFGGDTPTYVTTTSDDHSEWTTDETIVDQDGDGKYLFFSTFRGKTGEVYTSIVKLDSAHPAFSFWYLCQDDGADMFEVWINAGHGFEKLSEVSISSGVHRKWTEFVTSLEQFKGKSVQMMIRYRCEDYRPAIDNMQILDLSDVNLTIASVDYPRMLRPGVPAEFSVDITNRGANNSGRFNVTLVRDGESVSTASSEGIDFNVVKTLKLTATSHAHTGTVIYQIRVDCDADGDPSDNISKPVSIATVTTGYPAPENLKATVNGSTVNLDWSEPVVKAEYRNISDGAEDYPAFSIGMEQSGVAEDWIGDWTTIDGDGEITNVMRMTTGDYLLYPNLGQTMGFMVFDAEEAGVPKQLMSYFGAHTGRRSFVSVCTTKGVNDDWLVSPQLSGNAQTVKFYAKSAVTSYGNETFEFLGSSKGTSISDFVLISGKTPCEVSDEWTEFSFNVPAGTRYFAVHCISDQKYLFMVDDFEFEALNPHRALEIKGYNLYRDSEPMGSVAASALSFSHGGHDGQFHTYHATAVYGSGESSLSGAATVGVNGIDNVQDQNAAAFNVYGAHGMITISIPCGGKVTVSDLSGRIVAVVEGYDMTVEVAHGVYLVSDGSTTVKVAVD